MIKKIFKGKGRSRLFSVITAVGLVLLVMLNFLLTYVTAENVLYLDTTYEDLYTVSGRMEEECDGIFSALRQNGGEKLKITFCTDPDYIMQTEQIRVTYILAKKLEKMYPDSVEVVTVNAALNPTALSEYKVTSFTEMNASNIIVSYGGRYRITHASRFWVDTGVSYYRGEYVLATLIKSVTMVEEPSAYFITGHGEDYYDINNPECEMSLELYEFYNLLLTRGLNVKTLNLSEISEIPEDCVLLILNDPKTDFTYDADKIGSISYVSDIEKIDRYLITNQGAIMVAKDYRIKLPVLESFLSGWGFKFGDALVKDEASSLRDEENSSSALIAHYGTDKDGVGYEIYGDYVEYSSAPVTVVENAGRIECSFNSYSYYVTEQGSQAASRTYIPILTTSDGAKLYSLGSDGKYTVLSGDEGVYELAALTERRSKNPYTNEDTRSYVFCVNSGEFLSGKYISGGSSYANYDIISALTENISGTDAFASTDLGGASENSLSTNGKMIVSAEMTELGGVTYSNKYNNDDKSQGLIVIKDAHGFGTGEKSAFAVIVFIPPVALAILGIVVFIKRKFL